MQVLQLNRLTDEMRYDEWGQHLSILQNAWSYAWIAVIPAFIVFISRLRALAREKKRMPFPKSNFSSVPNPNWLFGNANTMLQTSLDGMEEVFVKHASPKSGISTFWFFSFPSVSVLKGEDAQKVLHNSVDRTNIPLFKRHNLRLFGSNSLLLSEGGSEWKAIKDIVHKAFTVAAIRDSQSGMARVSHKFAQSILRECKNSEEEHGKPSYTADLQNLLPLVTMDIFGVCALGYDFGSCDALSMPTVAAAFDFLISDITTRVGFRHLFNPALQLYFIPTERNRRHNRNRALVLRTLHEIINKRRAEIASGRQDGKKADMLTHMLRAADSNEMSIESFSGTLQTLLVAGYETTTIALQYAFYSLSINSRCDEMCAKEARAVLGVTSDIDLDKLGYCRAVILESLRLYSPTLLTVRNLSKPLVLDGYEFDAGTRAYVPIWFLQRDARNFPRPDEFLPERWVRENEKGEWVDRTSGDDEADELSGRIPRANRDAFLAFSGGARSCVGRRFALQEATVILAFVVRDLKVKTDEGYSPEIGRRFVVQRPKNGMDVTITKRD